MESKRLDNARSMLFHFVLWILLVLLAAITYMSYHQYPADTISVLTVLALLSCLYAVGKERRLRKQQVELSNELSDQQDKSADLEARLKELSGLYRAIATVNASASPERTFAAVLSAGLQLVGGNRGSLMLLDEDEEHLNASASPERTFAAVLSAGLQLVGGNRTRVFMYSFTIFRVVRELLQI